MHYLSSDHTRFVPAHTQIEYDKPTSMAILARLLIHSPKSVYEKLREISAYTCGLTSMGMSCFFFFEIISIQGGGGG